QSGDVEDPVLEPRRRPPQRTPGGGPPPAPSSAAAGVLVASIIELDTGADDQVLHGGGDVEAGADLDAKAARPSPMATAQLIDRQRRPGKQSPVALTSRPRNRLSRWRTISSCLSSSPCQARSPRRAASSVDATTRGRWRRRASVPHRARGG